MGRANLYAPPGRATARGHTHENRKKDSGIGGSYKSAAGSASGYMTGNYGLLSLSEGSSINVKNGGSLYAWGFVVGSGSVTAESGGTVWEWFQIDDFRGGTASGAMGNGVFPFSQYCI